MKINKRVAHRFGVATLSVVAVLRLASYAKNPMSDNSDSMLMFEEQEIKMDQHA
jgi:hypothetical protein